MNVCFLSPGLLFPHLAPPPGEGWGRHECPVPVALTDLAEWTQCSVVPRAFGWSPGNGDIKLKSGYLDSTWSLSTRDKSFVPCRDLTEAYRV